MGFPCIVCFDLCIMYLRGEIPDPSAAKVNLYESLSEMSNPMVTVDQSDFVDAGNYSQIREIKVSYANSLHSSALCALLSSVAHSACQLY